jgi:hypothetical protein
METPERRGEGDRGVSCSRKSGVCQSFVNMTVQRINGLDQPKPVAAFSPVQVRALPEFYRGGDR